MATQLNPTFTPARIRAMAKESGLPVKTVRAALLSGARQVKEACEAARPRSATREILTYSEVKTGDYFTLERLMGATPTAFLQTDDDTRFADYSANGRPVTRPRPTRLWDGCFLSMEPGCPIERVTREEAKQLVAAQRALYL